MPEKIALQAGKDRTRAEALAVEVERALQDHQAHIDQLSKAAKDVGGATEAVATLLAGQSIEKADEAKPEEVLKHTVGPDDGFLGRVYVHLDNASTDAKEAREALEHARAVLEQCVLALGGGDILREKTLA